MSLGYAYYVLLLFVIEVRSESGWPVNPKSTYCITNGDACPNERMKWVYDGEGCTLATGTNCTFDPFVTMFESEEECEHYCHGARCLLPPADYLSGPCKSSDAKLEQVWVYKNSTCQLHQYSGCGGSNNMFKSKQECEKHCENPTHLGNPVNLVTSNKRKSKTKGSGDKMKNTKIFSERSLGRFRHHHIHDRNLTRLAEHTIHHQPQGTNIRRRIHTNDFPVTTRRRRKTSKNHSQHKKAKKLNYVLLHVEPLKEQDKRKAHQKNSKSHKKTHHHGKKNHH